MELIVHPNDQRLAKLVCWFMWQKFQVRVVVKFTGTARGKVAWGPRDVFLLKMQVCGAWLMKCGYYRGES